MLCPQLWNLILCKNVYVRLSNITLHHPHSIAMMHNSQVKYEVITSYY